MKSVKLIVHGGAGDISSDTLGIYQKNLKEIWQSGYNLLKEGWDSLSVVEKVISLIEDTGVFDAGTGSFPNKEGYIEMDASIMTSDGRAGAVGGVRTIRNPIRLARLVMEETSHVMLVGEGAERFAEQFNLPPLTPRESPYSISTDTVGAVAMDKRGLISAGTSTGGIRGKIPGRIGDSPIIGAGTYASFWGGISATGFGEDIIKFGLAKKIDILLRQFPAQTAVDMVVEESKYRGIEFGVIVLDRLGNTGVGYTAKAMAWYPR
ncbi:MAG TPA: isoaspartyl peptidase/L-asparaginase family protein [bacterium]|nr:isoaspartyl peptidase/L-asparaginase family protein [bacterium]